MDNRLLNILVGIWILLIATTIVVGIIDSRFMNQCLENNADNPNRVVQCEYAYKIYRGQRDL